MPGLWDETLYAGSAEHYAIGRMPYPDRLAMVLRDALQLDGTGRLLDLGCGPGAFTLLVAPLFAEVVAVDADPDMVRVARDRAEAAGSTNVEWRHACAEDLPEDLAPFDVVTLAQSFHWMDRPLVATRIRTWLQPASGWCVHVGATTHEGVADDTDLPHPRPPREEITTLVRGYLGARRRAGRGVVADDLPDADETIFAAAGFGPMRRIEVPCGDVVVRTEDEVVSSVLSLSSATPHLFDDRLPAFVADLRALLRRTSPNGVFAERLGDMTLRMWPPAVSG
jgi:SAM-dependent methyltransferase